MLGMWNRVEDYLQFLSITHQRRKLLQGVPQYNGNISAINWKNKAQAKPASNSKPTVSIITSSTAYPPANMATAKPPAYCRKKWY